jgi:hypothetical protein
MERASLRPVPQRPARPVDPRAALAHVEAKLPDLDDAARQALALVDLAGRTRPQLRAETGIAADELADALARARKALRRAAFPLPGSGWCERAERLLSDQLDGELPDPGPRRLAVHLANCDRCVEHERRLWQARDQLVASFDEARAPAPAPAAEVAERPDPEPAELPDPEPLRLVAAAAEVPTPGTSAEVPTPGTPAPPPRPAPPGPPQPAEPEPEQPAAALEDAVAAALPRLTLAGLAWKASWLLALMLAVASVALTVYAVAGGSL